MKVIFILLIKLFKGHIGDNFFLAKFSEINLKW